MKKTLLFLSLCFPVLSFGQQVVTATITVTNATANGQTFTVNGSARTWTNTVTTQNSQILLSTNSTGAATALFINLAQFPVSPLTYTLTMTGTNSIQVQSFPGYSLTVSIGGAWATVSFGTNNQTRGTPMQAPFSIAGAYERTNVSTAIIDYVNVSTNPISATAPAMGNFVPRSIGVTNNQTGVTLNGNPAPLQATNTGVSSWVEGRQTAAIGDYSHAEGYSTVASGRGSHAECLGNISSGDYSHAEGLFTTASGSYAHSEGMETVAQGTASHAEGHFTYAQGTGSHVAGWNVLSTEDTSWTWNGDGSGVWITNSTQGSFVVNAPGGVSLFGAVNIPTSANIVNASLSNAVNYGNAFESNGTNTWSEQYGHLSIASGYSALAIGLFSSSSGDYSFACGPRSMASGQFSTAVGYQAIAISANASAFGYSATAGATNSIAIGFLSNSAADNSIAIGRNANVGVNYSNSTAIGRSASATAANQIMLGTSSIDVEVNHDLHVGGSIKSPTIASNLTLNSDIAFVPPSVLTLAAGGNAGVNTGTNVYIKVFSSTGAFSVDGFTGGRTGRYLIVRNTSAYAMTIANESGVEPAGSQTNRITTGTGANVTATLNATFIYDSSRWQLLNYR